MLTTVKSNNASVEERSSISDRRYGVGTDDTDNKHVLHKAVRTFVGSRGEDGSGIFCDTEYVQVANRKLN